MEDFAAFANSICSGGYLKRDKASQMVATLRAIPAIMEDEARLENFLDNALAMEGFPSYDIAMIANWLRAHLPSAAPTAVIVAVEISR